jgi:diguanylate cyclase (GGDEF)-like protein
LEFVGLPVNIVDLLDAGMPPTLRHRPELRNRGRVVVAVIGLNFLISMTLLAGFLLLTPWQGFSRDITLLLTALSTGCYGACLVLFRVSGAFQVCGNLFVACAYFLMLTSVVISGGFSPSPSTQMMLVVPVYAFMLANLRSGTAWSISVSVTVVMLYLAERHSVHFPQLVDAGFRPLASLIAWLTVLLVIVGSLLAYSRLGSYHEQALHSERNQLNYMAHHDPLTELPNRSYFLGRLARSVARARRRDENSALLYIDLDGFKPINDEHGHGIGDIVLRILAARLREVIRENDTVARMGGDEFAVILEDVRDREFAASVAQKLLQQLSEPVAIGGHSFAISGSVGIVMFPEQGSNVAQLCEQADQAMYRAKAKRNAAEFF